MPDIFDLDIQREQMTAESLHNPDTVMHGFETATGLFHQRGHFLG